MASSQTIAEAVENSLNAFNIISKKTLEAISYDQTVKCKIVDITNREFGEYKVNDGTSVFYAYSEKTDYYNGQTVWVTIPQGDYSKQKIIVGKYLESDNSEPYTYVSPLDSFVDMTQNLIEPGMVDTTGLIANGSTLGDTEYSNQITLWSVYGRELKGYDRLAIQASFKSWLKNLNVTSGEYGLKLNIEAIEMGTSQTSNNRSFYTVNLNTNDFYGDPYNFETPYSQVKVVDISHIPCIESLSLIFYEKDNFLKSDDTRLDYGLQNKTTSSLENIWVEKPYISLGYDISKFTTDTVLLTSLDSMTYATYLTEEKKEQIIESLKSGISDPEELHEIEVKIRSGESLTYEGNQEVYEDVLTPILEVLNKKKMTAQWIHFDDDKNAYVYGPNNENDILGDEAILHWYRYCYEDGINDKLAGNYWYEIEDLKNKYVYPDFNPDIDYPSEKFKVIVEYPSREYLASHIDTSLLAPIPDPDPRMPDDATIDIPVMDINNGETYYDYLMRVLDFLEEKNKEIYDYRYNGSTIDQIEDEIYAEYLQVLADKGLTPEQAAADTTSQIYRKKLMNIRDTLDAKTAKISERYNQITNALTDVNYYISNVLEFTNENEVPNQLTLTLVRGLTLQVDSEGYNGCYKVYDEEGTILSKKESQKKRIVKALWNSVITGVRELDEGIEVIEWHIPTENTMIQYPQEGIEYSYYDEFEYTDEIQLAQAGRSLYIKNSEGQYVIAQIDINHPDTSKKYYIRNTTKDVPHTDDERYFKIQRRAGSNFTEHEPGTEEASISEQVFRIKDFYTPTATNNTIECIVWKNNVKYQTSVDLIFGPVGTAGTDYTFELEVKDKVPALTYSASGSPALSMTLIPHLYNQKGEDEISKYLNKLTYGWWSPTTKDLESNTDKVISKEVQRDGSLILTLNNGKTLEEARYCVVQATLADVITSSDGKKIKLSAYKPIPIRLSDEYIGIEGADRISYNSRGTDPSFYKNPYQIFKYIDKKTTAITDNDIKWSISYGKDTKRSLSDSDIENFYPILSNENILIPPSIYLRDNGREVAVECYKGSTLIWTQPLYIYQNSYTSALLNSWDGSLTLDEESGIILSTAVGAGAKDNENRYNGVLMGDISGIDETPTFGMYGYHEGAQSFGFKIDGTAFIGKPNRGQINFDGNSGKISSLSHNIDPENPVGMLIDLDDGYIDMRGANVKAPIVSDQEKSLVTVLEEEKQKIQQKIDALEQEKSEYHEVNGQMSIQLIDNDITRLNEKITAIDEFLNQQELPDNNNDLYKILQELNLNYLITDDITYEENHSKVHIGVTDPYFYITSENGVDLVHVGKDEYFLQTDDYIDEETAREKAIEEADAKNVEKTGEHLSSDERDAIQGYGKGLKINLRGDDDNTGYIKGYNFLLKGVNNGISDDSAIAAMKDSSFELNSSGDPFFRVHYKNIDKNITTPFVERGLLEEGAPLEKDLMIISRDKFELKSHNYFANKIDPFDWTWQQSYQTNAIEPDKIGDGVYLDLMKGKLVGHNFSITAIEPNGELTDDGALVADYTGSYVAINSNGAPYLRIHYQNITDKTLSEDKFWTTTNSEGLYKNRSVDLINISKSAFTITSKDYQKPTGTAIGKGIHFNLNGDEKLNSENTASAYGSFIEAYSFGLEAYRPGLTTQIPSGRIKINSAATGKTTYDSITTYIPNYDYLDANPSGTTTAQSIQNYIDNCIDPSTGDFLEGLSQSDKDTFNSITGNYPNTDKKIARVITTVGDYPLMVGSLFSVNWDGKTTTGWLKATGGEIGPYHLTMRALYTNNGYLSNGKEFYTESGGSAVASAEPEPHGVYLGSDGFSVRKSFVIYNMPINRIVGGKTSVTEDRIANNILKNYTNLNANESYRLVKPIGYIYNSKEKKYEAQFEYDYDFVTSGCYYNKNTSTGQIAYNSSDYYVGDDYFFNKQPYDQIFVTSEGSKMVLGDLSFFLNGNSVLNGKTALNGNTYIFGNFQVGEYKSLGENLDDTSHFATLYANTTVYGIFRTTGKAFIGDVLGRWSNTEKQIRKTSRIKADKTVSESDSELGAIIYRNTYIDGYTKIAGGLVIGDKENPVYVSGSGQSVQEGEEENPIYYHSYETIGNTNEKEHVLTQLTSDFTSYTKFAKFYGDLEVGAGFVAGSLLEYPLTKNGKNHSATADQYSYLSKVPYYHYDGTTLKTDKVHGSGIISKYIFLGRTPTLNTDKEKIGDPTKINVRDLTTNVSSQLTVDQSDLLIYANTEQYGNFIAGLFGKKVELYANAGGDKNKAPAFIKLDQEKGINIQTGSGNPFSLKSNGGNITLDGRGLTETTNSSTHTTYLSGGGDILLYGGTGKLHLIGFGDSGDEKDYIKFTNGELSISATKDISMKSQYGKFSINNSGIELVAFGKDSSGNLSDETDSSNRIFLGSNGLSISTKGTINLEGSHGLFKINDSDGILIQAKKNGNATNDKISMVGGVLSLTSTGTINFTVGNSYFKMDSTDGIQLHGADKTGSGNSEHYSFTISGDTLISGNLTVTGQLKAANFKMDNTGFEAGGTSYQGTGYGGTGSAITSGASGVWLGGWVVVDKVLQSASTSPALAFDPSTAKINFGANDYIDGNGEGMANNGTASGKIGIKIHSNNSILLSASTKVEIGASNYTDTGFISINVSSSFIAITKNTYLTADYFYLGGSSTTGGAGTTPSYYLKNDGTGVFKDLTSQGTFKAVPPNGSTATELGKLAFANDVKKKYKLTLSQMNSSGTIEYFTTLNGKKIYLEKDEAPADFYFITNALPTLYINRKALPTLYKAKSNAPNIYKDVSKDIYVQETHETFWGTEVKTEEVYKPSNYGTVYYVNDSKYYYAHIIMGRTEAGWDANGNAIYTDYIQNVYINDDPWGSYGETLIKTSDISSDSIKVSKEDVPIYAKTTLASVGTSASITDIADKETIIGDTAYFKEKNIMADNLTKGKITDVVDQKKLTCAINGSVTKEITLEPSTETESDTIDILNSNFNDNAVAFSITAAEA